MIESYLIKAGLGCGSILNFQLEVKNDNDLNKTPRWYFRTPVKVSGVGFRSASLDLVFPFPVLLTDIDEKATIERLNLIRPCYEQGLIKMLESIGFTVPVDSATFALIPNYSGSSNVRNERKTFGGMDIHVLNAIIVVKWRESSFLPLQPFEPDAYFLQQLKIEQWGVEEKVVLMTAYNASAEFDALTQELKDLSAAQLAAMIDYNEALKSRIELLTT